MAKLSTAGKAEKKKEIMRNVYRCYCRYGLNVAGVKLVAQECNMTVGNLYLYFENADDMIVQSTAFCLSEIREELMSLKPENRDEFMKYIDEVPQWMAQNQGDKFRFIYQVCTAPKYYDKGKKLFEEVTEQYCGYARELEEILKIEYETIKAFLFLFIRTCVHYALFGEELYLNSQANMLKRMLKGIYDAES